MTLDAVKFNWHVIVSFSVVPLFIHTVLMKPDTINNNREKYEIIYKANLISRLYLVHRLWKHFMEFIYFVSGSFWFRS